MSDKVKQALEALQKISKLDLDGDLEWQNGTTQEMSFWAERWACDIRAMGDIAREAIALLSEPDRPVVSREMININGHGVETAVDDAWGKYADQGLMTYREFVSAGYDVAKSIIAVMTEIEEANHGQ